MLNAVELGTVVPIHRHPSKDESFVILRGKVRVSTHNDDGSIIEDVVLSQESGNYGDNVYRPLYEVASSKLARKTHVDMLNKVQINYYAAGLHREGAKAAFGEDCSGWLGWYVRPDGSITYSKPSDAVGRITFISSSSDVEVAAPGSRILVLSLESAGGADASFVWKPSASMSDRIDPAFADASAMNGLAICTAYHSDDYPALKAAWEYATAQSA